MLGGSGGQLAQQPQDINKLEEIKEINGAPGVLGMRESGDFDDTPFKK